MKKFILGIALTGFLAIAVASLHAEDIALHEEDRPISVEWIYSESHKIRYGLPSRETWSENGHALAYLIASTTEEPDLRILDAKTKTTQALFTPQTLAAKIDALNANGEIKESTRAVRIYSFEWIDDDLALRLNTGDGWFIYSLEDETLTKFDLPPGEKREMTFSPDGRFIAFVRNYDLYAYDFLQRREIRLTRDGSETRLNGELSWVYWEELYGRGSGGRGFVWSPDSRAIAYLQSDQAAVDRFPITDYSNAVPSTRMMFYPKAGNKNPDVRVGVVRLSTQHTQWMDLGDPYEYIARYTWTPDSDGLMIAALPRSQQEAVLLRADARTGASQVILREDSPCWVLIRDEPLFLDKSDDFLWLSERDGWKHIYRVSRDGRNTRRLTTGQWEVTDIVGVDERAGRIFFQATKESPIERHLYSVSLRGGTVTKLSSEPGEHSATLSGDGSYLYAAFTNADTPVRRDILSARGESLYTLASLTQGDYRPYRIQAPEYFTFDDKEGNTFHAQMLKPPDFDQEQQYPVVMSIYGGPGVQVVRNRFPDFWHQVLAENGFIVFSMDCRGSFFQGRDWAEPLYKRLGEIELRDFVSGVEHLNHRPYVDGERIGIWGWSYGGTMALNALVHAPETFRAGVSVAPVSDWRLYDTIYTERFMGRPDDNEEGYRASSPVHFAENLEGALLIAHGLSDDNVHAQNVYHFIDALIQAGKPYQFLAYPQKDHGIWGEETRIHLFNHALEFFKKELMEDF